MTRTVILPVIERTAFDPETIVCQSERRVHEPEASGAGLGQRQDHEAGPGGLVHRPDASHVAPDLGQGTRERLGRQVVPARKKVQIFLGQGFKSKSLQHLW